MCWKNLEYSSPWLFMRDIHEKRRRDGLQSNFTEDILIFWKGIRTQIADKRIQKMKKDSSKQER